MSVRLIADVLDSDLSPTRRLVALVLANYADDAGENAYPSVATICSKTGLKERAVRGAIGDLRDAGILEVTAPANTGRRSTTYRVVASHLPLQQMQGSPAGDAGVPLHDVHPSPAADAPKPSVNRPSTREEPVALAARSRPIDPIFEALYIVAFGQSYPGAATAGLTPTARGVMNRAVADLRSAGATPEEIAAVPDAWTALFTGREPPTCTPAAIAKWWPQLKAAMDRGYVARGAAGDDGSALRAAIEEASG